MRTKVENFTLNDLPIGTVRDFQDWTINANFEFSPNASINLPSVLIENTKDFDSSDTLRNAHDTFPTEGAILGFDVSNDTKFSITSFKSTNGFHGSFIQVSPSSTLK